jgi:tRNA(Arg) A34 adenosine deaminase TadA
MLAHKTLGAYQLNRPDLPACELVTSVEPCAMCLGAIPWSGVRQITCGAFGKDAESAGFDEGAKPANWTVALEQRGIRVVRGLLSKEAAAVLHAYHARGGPIYNGSGQKY